MDLKFILIKTCLSVGYGSCINDRLGGIERQQMNATVTHRPWRRLEIQLQKTWNDLTDADLAAISRNSNDLVRVVQNRYRRDRSAAALPAVQVLLRQIASLTNLCRRLPVSAFPRGGE